MFIDFLLFFGLRAHFFGPRGAFGVLLDTFEAQEEKKPRWIPRKGHIWGALGGHLGSHLAVIFDVKIDSVFGCLFESILEPIWDHLGLVLGAFWHPRAPKYQKVAFLKISILA